MTIGEHRKKLAIEKGRDPIPSELHLHVHTHGHDGKSFVGEHSRIVHVTPLLFFILTTLGMPHLSRSKYTLASLGSCWIVKNSVGAVTVWLCLAKESAAKFASL